MTTKLKQESAAPVKTVAAAKPAAKPAVKPAPAKVESKPVAAGAKPLEPEKAAKAEKAQKASKVIRDSFTFPETDYQKISELKKTCLSLGINAKKSEILRAGLHALAELDKEKLRELICRVEKIKTGRPLGSEPKKS
ncbi:MAG: hypothetical protein K2P57_07985 [Burkholderiales bacterium]|nr:hypothetical protein [Burkholderiales bacterium]